VFSSGNVVVMQGFGFAARSCMATPSDKRKRTLALQNRALRFSVGINDACPKAFRDVPSATVWGQLVRAADSTSNNLLEADDAASTADFLHKVRVTLREAKEARQCLVKLRLGRLAGHEGVAELEQEAGELAAIFAAIALNVAKRLEGGARHRPRRGSTETSN
jgi:four helix bundle protein